MRLKLATASEHRIRIGVTAAEVVQQARAQRANAVCTFLSSRLVPAGPSLACTWQHWNPAHLPGHTAEPNDPELEIRHQEDGAADRSEAFNIQRGFCSRVKCRRGAPSAPPRCQCSKAASQFAQTTDTFGGRQPSLGDTPLLVVQGSRKKRLVGGAPRATDKAVQSALTSSSKAKDVPSHRPIETGHFNDRLFGLLRHSLLVTTSSHFRAKCCVKGRAL